MCSCFLRDAVLPTESSPKVPVASRLAASDAERATRYFPTAVVLAADGTAFLRSQSLHCC